jgi:hypothetical protein
MPFRAGMLALAGVPALAYHLHANEADRISLNGSFTSLGADLSVAVN